MSKDRNKVGSPDLWELIHALTPAEKGVFKRMHAGGDGDAAGEKYIQLFEDLNACQRYQEDDFIQAHSHRNYVSNYAFQKNYLYTLILEDMLALRIRKSGGESGGKEFKARATLEFAHYLKEKRLFKQCQKTLKKARKEAELYELHEILLEILRTERALLMASQRKGYEGKIEMLHREISSLLQVMDNKYQILAVRDRAFQAIRKETGTQATPNTRMLKEYLEHPLLCMDENAISLDAKISQKLFRVTAYIRLGDSQKAWQEGKNIVKIWEDHPHLIKSRPLDFRNAVYNYLNISNGLGIYDDFPELIKRLGQKPFASTQEEAEMENHKLFLSLQYALNQHDWLDAGTIETEFVRKEKRLKSAIQHSRYVSYAASFGISNLMRNNYQAAGKWFDQGIHYGNPAIVRNLRRLCMLFRMIAAWDARELDEIDQVYRSVTRSSEVRKEFAGWELDAIETLHSLPETLPDQVYNVLMQLKTRIISHKEKAKAPGIEWLLLWLDKNP